VKNTFVFFSALALCGLANAASSVASEADDRPLVIFFGGHGASGDQMQDWENASTSKCGSHFAFKAMPYPPGANEHRSSVEGAMGPTVDKSLAIIADYMRQNPNRKVVIVGHSSGSAIADQVASMVASPDRATLITLDGFHPSPHLQSRMHQTECWSSEQPAAPGQSALKSPNYGTQSGGCGANFRVFETNGCVSRMCMHFRLVNKRVDPDLEGGEGSRDPDHGYRVKGYSNLSPNLDWLGKDACSEVPRARPQPQIPAPQRVQVQPPVALPQWGPLPQVAQPQALPPQPHVQAPPTVVTQQAPQVVQQAPQAQPAPIAWPTPTYGIGVLMDDDPPSPKTKRTQGVR
jgi:hypothetical protein